eukprot:CAMPEP_0172750390 /NCGR_PEP_ID=MMETSP1074-20121228/149482_1 /TAXON_ID=2916 /ORGANISM="Ceratium fusus, Strain PA161109" /LENGTH=60 /DNA_ID=CAMNT_0013582521 /DNA_START=99 /DNA_END=281 /DNA_ORIENTATION=+
MRRSLAKDCACNPGGPKEGADAVPCSLPASTRAVDACAAVLSKPPPTLERPKMRRSLHSG